MSNLSKHSQKKLGLTGKTLAALFISCFFVVFFTACEKKGPLEKAGESADKAVEDAGDAIEDAGDDIQDKTSH